jgi:hypothetical protein
VRRIDEERTLRAEQLVIDEHPLEVVVRGRAFAPLAHDDVRTYRGSAETWDEMPKDRTQHDGLGAERAHHRVELIILDRDPAPERRVQVLHFRAGNRTDRAAPSSRRLFQLWVRAVRSSVRTARSAV